MYTSPAFLDAYREVQNAPNEPGCNLEKVVIGMMFASDQMLLTTFRDAKLWPGYLYWANDSKYCRCQPSLCSCEHIVYFRAVSLCFRTIYPGWLTSEDGQLPGAFKDFASQRMGRSRPSRAFMTHC